MKFLVSLLLFTTLLFAQDKPRVAVLDFDGHDDATVLSDAVRSELLKSDAYTIISRSDMGKIIMEQEFQLSGIVDEETSVELGKLLGAQQLVIGNIKKVGINYFLTVKMVDIETGVVTASESVKGMSMNTLSTMGVKKIVKALLPVLEAPAEDTVSVEY